MSLAPAIKSILLAGSLLGVAAALSGCGHNPGGSSLKTPAVTVQTVHHDIVFGPDHQILPEQVGALHAFLDRLELGYGTRVTLEDNGADGAPLRWAAVSAVLAEHGAALAQSAPPRRSGMPAGTARLWIERAQATLPVCPDWSDSPLGNMNASTHSNYGCAVNSNLAAMAADPGDLEQGRVYNGPSGADIARDQDYQRQRVPSGFNKPLEKASTTNSIRTGGGGGGN